MSNTADTNILVYLLVIVGIFFICREILCWYWKINRMVALLETIAENTKSEKNVKDHVPFNKVAL